MENIINTASEFLVSIDLWIYALGGLLAAAVPVVKLTKNKIDDKYVQKAIEGLNKFKAFLAKFKPSIKK